MKNDKLLFAVGMLALTTVLFSGYYAWFNKQMANNEKAAMMNATAKTQAGGESMTQTKSLPAATGDIDDLTSAIETDLDNQESVLSGLEAEADVVTSDGAALEGFGQVYNENDY